jgi:hypothetical protein
LLLAKLQERRGSYKNPQVQLIYVEPHGVDPRVTVITRGGTSIGEDRAAQGKTADNHEVRKATKRTPMFDAKKER